jgi:hypothetical protein
MIVSGREAYAGVEIATHPADFSNQSFKQDLRSAIPKIYSLLPPPRSEAASASSKRLGDRWNYERKSRLGPDGSDFPDLDAWLEYFKSPAGADAGGGCISRYLRADELVDAKLDEIVQEMAEHFRPLMETVVATGSTASGTSAPNKHSEGRSFGELLTNALRRYAEVRGSPFRERRISGTPKISFRPFWKIYRACRSGRTFLSGGALEKGVWAKVPWIALMNGHVTTSTQSGVYIVILVAEDLSTVYVRRIVA